MQVVPSSVLVTELETKPIHAACFHIGANSVIISSFIFSFTFTMYVHYALSIARYFLNGVSFLAYNGTMSLGARILRGKMVSSLTHFCSLVYP